VSMFFSDYYHSFIFPRNDQSIGDSTEIIEV
jgi:hypothetical protein